MSLTSGDYQRLLGIRVQSRPNHYQLLALDNFEQDPQTISSAIESADRQLRAIENGPDLKVAQALMNELAAAKLCLCDSAAKAKYDACLRNVRQPGELPKTSQESSASLVNIEKSESIQIEADKQQTATALSQQGKLPTQQKSPYLLPVGVFMGAFLLVGIVLGAILWSSSGSKDQSKTTQTTEQKADPRRTKSKPALENNRSETTKESKDKKSLFSDESNLGLSGLAGKKLPPINKKLDLPVTKGLLFWLDASDADKIEINNKDEVTSWEEKGRDLYVEFVDQPRLTKNGNGYQVVEFSGKQGALLPDLRNFSASEFTIAFLAAGDGILLAKGDAYREPSRSFSIMNKGHMRLRIDKSGFLHENKNDKENHSGKFVPRLIEVRDKQIRFFVKNQLCDSSDEPFKLDNQHPFSIGLRQSSNYDRTTKDRFQGTIGEIIFYDRILSEQERQLLVQSLCEKWGLDPSAK